MDNKKFRSKEYDEHPTKNLYKIVHGKHLRVTKRVWRLGSNGQARWKKKSGLSSLFPCILLTSLSCSRVVKTDFVFPTKHPMIFI